MSKIMIGTDEVLKVMFGLDEVSSLSMGEETIPITPPTPPAPVYSAMPFTIEALGSGNITIKPSSSSLARKFYYSINGGNQVLLEIGGSISAIQIPVSQGDVIEFVAKENQKGTADGTASFISFDTSGGADFKVYGNIMSLSYVDYLSASAMPASYCYARMFKSVLSVIDAENLVVPDVALTNYCFENCFSGATNLETMPQLNPTTLGEYCYQSMFQGCTSLTSVRDLQATALTRSCYSSMFNGCTSLTTAPQIYATTLNRDCCWYMFNGCTSLTTAPDLLSTSLERGCYGYMFQNCSSLSYIKCLADTNFSVYQVLAGWTTGVASNGTFVKAAGVTWPSGANGIPTGWTVVDA